MDERGRGRVHPRRALELDSRGGWSDDRSSQDPPGSAAGRSRGGKTTLVLIDTDAAWVNQKEVQVLDGGKDLLVSSERDGYTHLYRYDADGRLLDSVTRGPWSVRGPSGFYRAPLDSAWVDPKSEWFFFTARQKPEGERQLYRVRVNGTGMQRISREDGTTRSQ